MESVSVAATNAPEPDGIAPGSKGLKSGALGYLSNLVIGVASTAPGYSLAATLGFVVAVKGVGLQAPAVLLVSFLPMLLIAAAYNYMNKADPDCGTSFTWVTKAIGPRAGWLTGWAIVVADIVVMATLAYIAGVYSFLLVGWDAGADSLLAVSIAAAVWIAVMTWICYVGIELSARTQYFLLAMEIVTLALFAIVALVKVYAGSAPATSINPSLDWLNPFGMSFSALIDGVLLGVFIYWGWDSGVCVNEESEDSANGPGKAAVMSTIVLVGIYVVVSISAQAFAGTEFLRHNKDDVLSALGGGVFGSPLDKLLIIAVLTSAAASTQTTILPTARTTLSMARFGAAPKALGDIHPTHLTPGTSTLLMGGISLLWTLFIINVSQNVLGDSITGLGFQIAFYYGLTGFACAIYYRRELFKSAKNFVMVGLAPLLGGAMLTFIFVKAFIDNAPEDSAYSGGLFGIGAADVIGVGLLILGAIVMLFAHFAYPAFFRRKRKVADPRILTGEVAGEASVMADP
jgi:amino acid transporter